MTKGKTGRKSTLNTEERKALHISLGGRPGGSTAVKDVEELKTLIGEYLQICADRDRMPTKSGLCFYLGIARDTLNKWERGGSEGMAIEGVYRAGVGVAPIGFSDCLKRFSQFISDEWQQRLVTGAPVGSIFWLKNEDSDNFKDRIEGGTTPMTVNFLLPPEIQAKYSIPLPAPIPAEIVVKDSQVVEIAHEPPPETEHHS